jgi:hypothetical protein
VDATHRMSLTQRLVTKLVPRRAQEIERESREWLVICPNCGHERSYYGVTSSITSNIASTSVDSTNSPIRAWRSFSFCSSRMRSRSSGDPS